jgi:hypothetical protein
MSPKLKRRLIWIGVICIALFLVSYCFSDFWEEQSRIYILGLLDVRSEEYGISLPDADEVDVMTLGDESGPALPGTNYIQGYPITGRTVLMGDDAMHVVKLWRFIPRSDSFLSLCFNPVYGLQFRQRGKLLFETVVCWHCSTYTIPMPFFGTAEYGFEAGSEDAQALLHFLESRLPLAGQPKSARN